MTPLSGSIIAYFTRHFVVELVWLAGVILAIVSRQQYPRTSRLTLIALAVFFVESWVGIFASYVLPFMLVDQGLTPSQFTSWYYPLLGIILSLIRAGAWGLILAAIFGRRD